MTLILDRVTPRPHQKSSVAEKSAFAEARRAELEYARKLRQVAKNVGEYIKSLFPGGKPAYPGALADLHKTMQGYARLLRPWATVTANRMLADVDRRDIRAWMKHSAEMHRNLTLEIRDAPVGDVIRQRLAAQVNLITSIPLEAAERVHKLALESVVDGGRSHEIAAEIIRSTGVTERRANLIARTEVGRASTEFTRARAERVGSTHFVWMTARDRDVRPMHKQLHGTVHRWDDPPIAEVNGERHLPGAFPNCRCWANPIVADSV